MSPYREEIIIQYLLNTLSEEAKEEFEETFFANDELFEQLKVVEMKLIDRFARREMTPGEEKQFRENFINTPERAAMVSKSVSFHRQLNEFKADYEMENSITTATITKDVVTDEGYLAENKKNRWLSNLRSLFDFTNPFFAGASALIAVIVLTVTIILIASRYSNENLVAEVTNNNRLDTENGNINLPPSNNILQNNSISDDPNQNIQNTNQNEKTNNKSNKDNGNMGGNSQRLSNTQINSSQIILANLEPQVSDKEITTANPKRLIEQEIKLEANAEKVNFRLRLNSDISENAFTVSVLKKTGETIESIKNVTLRKVEGKNVLSVSVSTQKLAAGSYFITVIGMENKPIIYPFSIIREN